MHRFATSCLCAVCAFVFVACGGGSKKATTSTTTVPLTASVTAPTPTETASVPTAIPQACELATKADAETVLGITLLKGEPTTSSDTDSCGYSADPNGPVGQLEIYVGDGAKNIYDVDNDVLHHDFIDVPGLGDESHEEDFYIFFRKGARWVAVHIVVIADWSEYKARTETLAKQVADKL